jgi:putative hemolysin
MLFSLLLLSLFVLLSAFFSSSETAFLSANRTTLESLEAKGSKPARRVRRILSRINDFLTTILIGNTLVNAAAASPIGSAPSWPRPSERP